MVQRKGKRNGDKVKGTGEREKEAVKMKKERQKHKGKREMEKGMVKIDRDRQKGEGVYNICETEKRKG